MTKTEKKEKENGKLSYYKIDHVAVDSPTVTDLVTENQLEWPWPSRSFRGV